MNSFTHQHPAKVFAMDSSRAYAEEVAASLGIPITLHEEMKFEDGEFFCRSIDGPEGNVRGHDVFVVQSLYADEQEGIGDKFLKLAMMCGSLHTASAHDIIAVMPYLAFARQDRKEESRAPINTKIIERLLKAVGVTRALAIDVHNISAIQNAYAFEIQFDNLECKNLFADWFGKELQAAKKIVVLSPDSGGYRRADNFRNVLAKRMGREIGIGVFDKLRKNGDPTGSAIVGDVSGAEVIIYDDLISTAKTMCRAASTVTKFGGHTYAMCASHGLFVGEANKYLEEFDALLVDADTVPPFRLSEKNRAKYRVVKTAPMVAEAMRRIHTGTGSISDLLRS